VRAEYAKEKAEHQRRQDALFAFGCRQGRILRIGAFSLRITKVSNLIQHRFRHFRLS
jgi:hypothetical protein